MTTETNPARALAMMKPKVAGICERCGVAFMGPKGRRWCSNACKVAAYQKRRRAAAPGRETAE